MRIYYETQKLQKTQRKFNLLNMRTTWPFLSKVSNGFHFVGECVYIREGNRNRRKKERSKNKKHKVEISFYRHDFLIYQHQNKDHVVWLKSIHLFWLLAARPFDVTINKKGTLLHMYEQIPLASWQWDSTEWAFYIHNMHKVLLQTLTFICRIWIIKAAFVDDLLNETWIKAWC